MDLEALIARYVSVAAPPGEEEALAAAVADDLAALGLTPRIDARGNVLVGHPDPKVLVTAHLDETALIVTGIRSDGRLAVSAIGGMRAFKEGERPVSILSSEGPVPGILSVGSVHTNDSGATANAPQPLAFSDLAVFTGFSAKENRRRGIRVGNRVVIAPPERHIVTLGGGDFLSARFLDDRALVAILAVLAGERIPGVACAFTVSEETGGEGALYALQRQPAEAVLALEIGPNVPDAPVVLGAGPTVWAKDGYAAMSVRDLNLVHELGIPVQVQVLSRGGSDASIAASQGLCARHFTLGLPVENSHGWEICHRSDLEALLDLTRRVLAAL